MPKSSLKDTPEVTLIIIEMTVDGNRKHLTFIRPDKIEKLLRDDYTTLGGFLRSIRDIQS